MINLVVNGVVYEGFKEASVSVSMESLSGSFVFTVAQKDGQVVPFKGGESCVVNVSGEQVLDGYIERVDVKYQGSMHTIVYSGRDKTADFGDSDLMSVPPLTTPIQLGLAISKIANSIPGNQLIVIDDTSGLEAFSEASNLLSPEDGQNAFDFIEKLCRQRQVLLTTNGFGNLVIARPSTERYEKPIINKLNDVDKENNILSADVTYNLADLYRTYRTTAQLSTTSTSLEEYTAKFAGKTDLDNLTSQNGVYIDDTIRGGRQIVMVAEQTMDSGDAFNRAEWERNIRQSRSRLYRAKVQGFSNGGRIWRPNTLLSIQDEFADINEIMMVRDVSYMFGMDGSKTELTLIDRDAYNLAFQEPIKKKKGKTGAQYLQ